MFALLSFSPKNIFEAYWQDDLKKQPNRKNNEKTAKHFLLMLSFQKRSLICTMNEF